MPVGLGIGAQPARGGPESKQLQSQKVAILAADGVEVEKLVSDASVDDCDALLLPGGPSTLVSCG